MAGKIVHFEIVAEDAQRAKAFYGTLFGWKFREWSGPGEYHMFEGEPGGAIYPYEERDGHYVVYFDTDDIDATIGQIRDLGGEAGDKTPIPEIGWFARCKDTEGNAFSLFQADASVPVPDAGQT